jgi:hypothetical protein
MSYSVLHPEDGALGIVGVRPGNSYFTFAAQQTSRARQQAALRLVPNFVQGVTIRHLLSRVPCRIS